MQETMAQPDFDVKSQILEQTCICTYVGNECEIHIMNSLNPIFILLDTWDFYFVQCPIAQS